MRWQNSRFVVLLLSLAIYGHVACGSTPGPSPLPNGYAGEWTGTTAEGTPVQFSVSAADEVTAFTLAFRLSDTCAGTLTNTNLAVPIHRQDPPGPPPYDQPGFAFGTNEGTRATAIGGHFSPDRRSAEGQFVLVRYGACGTVTGKWSAQRR
jgi:hypothetical protein